MSKQLVLMDHDGGVDDYLATMLLMTMDQVDKERFYAYILQQWAR